MALPIVTMPKSPNAFQSFMQGLGGIQQARKNALQVKKQHLMNENLPQMLNARQALLQAQARKANVGADLMPRKMDIAEENAQTRQNQLKWQRTRFGKAYQISKLMQSPAFENLVSKNPQLARIFINAATNSIQKMPMQEMMGDNPSMQNPKQKSIQQVSQSQSPNPLSGQLQGTSPMQVTPEQLQNAVKITPEQLQSFQDVAGSEAIKRTTPTKVQYQRVYSQTLGNLFDKAEPMMDAVSQYAGIVGKGKGGIDKLKAAFGSNSPQYTKYYLFTRDTAPIIANEMRRALAGQATDKEMKAMNQLSNPTYWDANPDLALKQFNDLRDIFENRVDQAITQSQAQIQASLKGKRRSQASNAGAPKQMAPKKDQQSKNFKMPTFQSKAQFQSWYNGLSPQKKAQVRTHLGGQ